MNKTEFIRAVAKQADISGSDAKKIVDAIFDVLTNALKAGEKITFIGFGTFEVKHRSARQGRNPRTGQSISIAAAKIPSFKAGQALKNSVQGPPPTGGGGPGIIKGG